MKITEMFFNIKTDLSAVGLIRDKSFPYYFCTPVNAIVFANLGVDGIHFCIVPKENDQTLERSPVYVISPMLDQNHWIMIAAEDFNTFLSLVVSVKDAGALECVSYLPEDKYADYLKTIVADTADSSEVGKALEALSDNFQIKEISDVYGYVRRLQKSMDLTQIKFSNEYYDLIQ